MPISKILLKFCKRQKSKIKILIESFGTSYEFISSTFSNLKNLKDVEKNSHQCVIINRTKGFDTLFKVLSVKKLYKNIKKNWDFQPRKSSLWLKNGTRRVC